MKEIWKDIKDYRGYYQVSNLGRVKGIERIVYAGSGKYRKQYEKIMSNKKNNGNGYKIVSLNKDGISKNYYVHRLVAESFIPNLNNYPQINHKNENKSDNNINNLEWCTPKYNNCYGTRLERLSGFLVSNKINWKAILQIDDDNNIICRFDSIKQASKYFNISNQAISDCLRGKQNHSAGYKWKYAND